MLDQVILNMDAKPPYQQEAAMRKEPETMHPALRDVTRDADKLEMYRIKPPVERNGDSLYEYDTYSTAAENDGTAERETPQRGKLKDIGDLIGGIFCVFVSLCAGAIVLGARLIKSVELSGNNELYLCGAVGMAGVAGVLFFA